MSDRSKLGAVPPADGARLRWAIYTLLIALSAGLMLARIARLEPSDPKSKTPFLSANDRSRWATIRALGDDNTYAIDHIIFDSQGRRVRGWHTIDLVKHRGPDGREHYYSSKPTLLPTMLAGEYWLIKQMTGATLAEDAFYIARIMLVLTNVLPLIIALVFLARLIDQFGKTDVGRVIAVASAAGGTFLTTFAVTLNNHSVAAISATFALAAIVPIWRDGKLAWWRFALTGLFLAFMAANELPALSLCVLAGAGLAWKFPLRTLVAFVPAVALIAVGAFGTNYLAHRDWKTPYAHRHDGPVLATIPAEVASALDYGQVSAPLVRALRHMPFELSDQLEIEVREAGKRWVLWDEETHRRLALVQASREAGSSSIIEIRRWDNWYDYEGSYWRPESIRGIDVGESSPAIYAFNVLIGHHGLFSLTPLWLLSAAGCVMWLRRGTPTERTLAITTIVITLVVLAFYLTRPQIDRNYGGGTCCLRWMIWLTPLWLLTLLPTADWLSHRRIGIALCAAALVWSTFSASYGADNPWSHPWIFDYWTHLGWIKY